MNSLRTRDEREAAVDLGADRIGYLVLSFGLLLIVTWRAYAAGESSWDLLALVVVGGVASALYRVRHRAATRDAGLLLVLGVLIAVAVALVLTAALTR